MQRRALAAWSDRHRVDSVGKCLQIENRERSAGSLRDEGSAIPAVKADVVRSEQPVRDSRRRSRRTIAVQSEHTYEVVVPVRDQCVALGRTTRGEEGDVGPQTGGDELSQSPPGDVDDADHGGVLVSDEEPPAVRGKARVELLGDHRGMDAADRRRPYYPQSLRVNKADCVIAGVGAGHQCVMAISKGPSPTLIVLITRSLRASITVRVSAPLLQTNTRGPCGVLA